MSLEFFADHCVPRSIIESLRAKGYNVRRLRDHLPPDTPDPQVIQKAQELGDILLTLNGDFSDIISYPPSDFGGIIAIQLRNRPEVIPEVMKRLHLYLTAYSDREHYRGILLVVEVGRIRIRR